MSNGKNLFSKIYRRTEQKQKFVLGIMASPRIAGNCDILINKALEAARGNGARTEKIVVNNLHFAACQSCENIKDNGKCNIQDDFQRIYAAVMAADSLIVASPIYFGSVTAQLKALIDRFQCHWRAINITKTVDLKTIKQGGFICVQASSRDDFFENAKFILKHFFATIGVQYKDELLCTGINEKGSVLNTPSFLEKAVILGENLSAVN